MAYRLGVDLGTTFTAAVLLREHAAPEVFALGERSAAVPTVLFIGADGSVLYGEAAETRALNEPGRLVRQFRRRVGDEVPLVIGTDADGHVEHHAHDLAAAMISWVVATVATREGEAPDAIAVTHPATWGPHKTELLRAALAPHGLANLTLVSEPEAAAYTYAYAGRLQPGDTVAVYDLGGGTFDAAVLHANDDGRFGIIGRPLGLPDVGGIDFDDAIFAHVLGALSPAARGGLGIDERTGELTEAGATAIAAIRAECTAAKEALSTSTSAIVPVTVDGHTTQIRLTRAEFETLILGSLLPTLSVLDHATASADVTSQDLACVVLSGASSRIPVITQMLSAHLGLDVDISRDIDPKMAVAAGAVLAITALAPEAHAAATTTGPSAVTGIARARARADKAEAARTKAGRVAKTPPPMAMGGDELPVGKVARLKGAAARALPHGKSAPLPTPIPTSMPDAEPMVPAQAPAPVAKAPKAKPTPIPAPAASTEPVEIPRAITTDAGKAAFERLAAAKAAREAATQVSDAAARAAVAEADALLDAEEDDGAPKKPAKAARVKRPFGKSTAPALEGASSTDDDHESDEDDRDPYSRPVSPVSADEDEPVKAPARAARVAGPMPIAPPSAPAKDEHAFVQPKGKVARTKAPAPKADVPAVAAKPAAREATPVQAKTVETPEAPRPVAPVMRSGVPGTGRPILPRRGPNRSEVVGLDQVPGARNGSEQTEQSAPAPQDRAVVAPRAVGGLADLLGADPHKAWFPEDSEAPVTRASKAIAADVAAAAAETAELAEEAAKWVAPPRPTVRQEFFADGVMVDLDDLDEDESDDDTAGTRRHPVLTMRRVFSARRVLTVTTLTAAIFVGSGAWSAAIPAITDQVVKASSQTAKDVRK